MIIKNYRFLEMTGEGGESNPCYKPLYDETIAAPPRHTVDIDGTITEKRHDSVTLDANEAGNLFLNHGTVGPVRNFAGGLAPKASADDATDHGATLAELFRPPESVD